MNAIKIIGARQHNLKNVCLSIPRDRFVVITGPSGSGKSSLAFDTLYAEGRRRYVESLSAYARQFLDQLEKPDVDFIEGLSPSIALDQRNTGGGPRSTIATSTEIYDFLRLLYASVGQPHDPKSGRPLRRQTTQTIVDEILQFKENTKVILLAPLVKEQKGEFRDVLEKIKREGFVRARLDGEIVDLSGPQPVRLSKNQEHTIEAVIDRLVVKEGLRMRLADSVEVALRWGKQHLTVLHQGPDSATWDAKAYATNYSDPVSGFTLPPLTPKHFSFNSHFGACPHCHGLGTVPEFEESLVMPDLEKSLAEGAVLPWHKGVTARMRAYYKSVLQALAKHYDVPWDQPLGEAPEKFREVLWEGSGEEKIGSQKPFEGVLAALKSLYESTESELTKHRLHSYQIGHPCPVCHAARLKPEILAVTLSTAQEALNIRQFCALTIEEAKSFIENLALTGNAKKIAHEITREIIARLGFLKEVGLSYLTLERESSTLSGGETQRIRLAAQIGSGLAGVLYVLDEPSIGLHQRDNDRLISTLVHLRDLGNSVVVVEHDEDTIRAADWVIDMGPGAGPRGGRVVAEGTVEKISQTSNSPTGQYLSGQMKISVPKQRVVPPSGWLEIIGATENNLKDIHAKFPVGCLTCVTGVSGSGKSTLVDDTLRRVLSKHFYRSKDKPGKHKEIRGLEHFDHSIVIDQSPIGRSPRSNPATYSGAFGPIRELFSNLPAARVRGYDAGRFSFNVRGGRCEHCQGDGKIKVEMQFLPNVYVQCEVCEGKRYSRETLEISYKGKNIADVLEMSIEEAARFFRAIPAIGDKLNALESVGLGYLQLGQSADTLSGGEAQRVKLAAELAKKSTGRTIYLFDEPTTGLHFVDIEKLLEVFFKLRDAGNTLIVIEHNLEVIKSADWIIDLGPEGGGRGGEIVGAGTPEQIAALEKSHTGHYLKRVLCNHHT